MWLCLCDGCRAAACFCDLCVEPRQHVVGFLFHDREQLAAEGRDLVQLAAVGLSTFCDAAKAVDAQQHVGALFVDGGRKIGSAARGRRLGHCRCRRNQQRRERGTSVKLDCLEHSTLQAHTVKAVGLP